MMLVMSHYFTLMKEDKQIKFDQAIEILRQILEDEWYKENSS